jgi:transposase
VNSPLTASLCPWRWRDERAARHRLEIVKRNELHKFVVLPKRWIVERTLAWISRNRRLARDSSDMPALSPPSVRARDEPPISWR